MSEGFVEEGWLCESVCFFGRGVDGYDSFVVMFMLDCEY